MGDLCAVSIPNCTTSGIKDAGCGLLQGNPHFAWVYMHSSDSGLYFVCVFLFYRKQVKYSVLVLSDCFFKKEKKRNSVSDVSVLSL